MERSIEDHGIIGDLSTIALVATDGAIDFLCWPHFDSPSVFAALLDHERGGAFEIVPELSKVRRRQLYLPDTNVLLTRFLSADGVAEISDFMAIDPARPGQRLIRRVKSVRGKIAFRMSCTPRFDYARADALIEPDERGMTMTSAGGDGTALRLVSNMSMDVKEDGVEACFELGAHETAYFILEDAEAPISDPLACVSGSFKATSDYWRDWSARSTYQGRWLNTVRRSALVLKLLTSAEHGSIIAAPTFGLPEEIGGSRNWDYRYTWIRDGSFTVYGFMRIGHTAEANAFMHWLGRRAEESGDDGTLDILYGVDGHTDLTEIDLPHLRGHLGSTPVRIGNDAHGQLQLDIYGELMDAVYLCDKFGERVSYEAWEGVQRALNWLESQWQQPDEGIWEVRGGRKELLFSRLMCWVAFDRGIRLALKRSLPAPLADWQAARDAIRADIHQNFWNDKRGAFVQAKGGDAVDASCLLMPLVRFIAPTDPRWLSTLKAVEEELTDDSLVYRYSTDAAPDGLDGIEGTFNMCSFWYIECLARAGRLEKARFLFDKMLGYANHLGLYAEEIGPSGEQLGNFPQAFTHLALISAAHYLDRHLP